MLRTPKNLTIAAGAVATLAGAALLLAPTSAPAIAQEQAEQLKEGAFKVDGAHSNVNFSVIYKNSSRFFGRFNKFDGSYLVDPANTDESYIDLIILTGSVDTNSEGRDRHLRQGDFFAARQFPEATFKSTSAERVDEDTVRFTGDFTIRGVTQEIEIDAEVIGSTTDPGSGTTRSGWITTFSFNRSEFNVAYGIPQLSDETELTVSMTGEQQ